MSGVRIGTFLPTSAVSRLDRDAHGTSASTARSRFGENGQTMTNQDNKMNLWRDDRAANAVEYGLIAAVIAVALIIAFTFFRDQLANLFNRQANKIQGAG
jgi:pilus assembly protein Flp/PilA